MNYSNIEVGDVCVILRDTIGHGLPAGSVVKVMDTLVVTTDPYQGGLAGVGEEDLRLATRSERKTFNRAHSTLEEIRRSESLEKTMRRRNQVVLADYQVERRREARVRLADVLRRGPARFEGDRLVVPTDTEEN